MKRRKLVETYYAVKLFPRLRPYFMLDRGSVALFSTRQAALMFAKQELDKHPFSIKKVTLSD